MEAMLIVIPMFVVAFFGTGVAVVMKIFREMRHSKAEQQRAEAQSVRSHSSDTRVSMTEEQKRRLNQLREQQKQKTASEKHEKHQADAHEHGHAGEEEHYEEIIGSLGDISDEGCEDLSGVRFIMHDLAYDTSDGGEHDYTALAKAMVLGEIINSPRFKQTKNK